MNRAKQVFILLALLLPLTDAFRAKISAGSTEALCSEAVTNSSLRNSAWRQQLKCKCADGFVVHGEDSICWGTTGFDRYFNPELLHGKGCSCVKKEDIDGSASSAPTSFWAWLGNSNVIVDAAVEEEKLRKRHGILFDDEHVDMAFKVGNDKSYLTNKRMLFRWKSWLDTDKASFTSVPYTAIKSFAVQTAGAWPDMDTDLKIWTDIRSIPYIEKRFRKGTRSEKADIFAIHKYITAKVPGMEASSSSSLLQTPELGTGNFHDWSSMGDFFAWLGSNADEVDATEVEKELRKPQISILQDDEHLEMAFKVGRDTSVLTNKRFLRINVKALTGKQVEYASIPYASISAFAVQTAGEVLDWDMEMTLWTNAASSSGGGGGYGIQQDFRKGNANMFKIQDFLASKVLGSPMKEMAQPGDGTVGQPNNVGNIIDWLGNNAQQISPQEADTMLRKTVSILQDDEYVELAYRVWRDIKVVTNKRYLSVDVKGMTGAKVEYKTIPWESVRSFSVRSAGSWDRDSEFNLYTSIYPPPRSDDYQPPGQSWLYQDLRKGKADIFALQKSLTVKLLGKDAGSGSSLAQAEWSGSDDFFHWLGSNARSIDPAEARRYVDQMGPILQSDEKVEMAFQMYRDMTLLTSKRMLFVDVIGFTGQRIDYLTVPYNHIDSYAIQTAGTFDFDSELKIVLKIPWLSYKQQDFRKSDDKQTYVDLFAISEFLSDKVMTVTPSMPSNIQLGNNPVDDLLDWLGSNNREIDAKEAEEKIRASQPKLLQDDETVVKAFQVWRDTTLLTSKRMLSIDVIGLTGKKVQYWSVPFKSLRSYAVQTAGYWDRDAEIKLYTNMHYIKQDLRKGTSDLFAIERLLADKCIA